MTVVFEGNAGFLCGLAQDGEALGGAPAAVERAGFEEFFGMFAVGIQAVGLQVGAKFAALARAFIEQDDTPTGSTSEDKT